MTLPGRDCEPLRVKANGPLAHSFSRHGQPIWEMMSCGEEEHGLLRVDDLTGTGIFYRCIPLFNEENTVTGTVITLEKRGDEALGQALKFLGLSHEEIMDQIPEGVFLVNTRWQVSFFNRTAQEITGYSRDEAMGKFCWAIFRSELCQKKCPLPLTGGGLGAADLAGVKSLSYFRGVYLIPVNCLGSIDPTIFSMAFVNGVNSILLAGCTPHASCHYVYGVDHSWYRVNVVKKLLSLAGMERRRITMGYVDVNQPEAFVNMVESHVDAMAHLDPINRDESTKTKL